MHPISKALCQAYDVLLSQGQVSFPLTEKNKENVDSVVKTVNGIYFGFSRFPTQEDKAIAYLCFLIKDHPFSDGNKRTALLWFEIYCDVAKLTPKEPDFGYDALAVAIEAARSDKMDSLLSTVKSILFQI